jgi:hypothetical protein
MAESPEQKAIEIKKAKLINKISKRFSTLHFENCMKCGDHEQVVLRCMIDENEKVIVKSILGCNEKLKLTILKKMKKSKFKISSELCGQEFALHLKFEKRQRN